MDKIDDQFNQLRDMEIHDATMFWKKILDG